ncbi:MAG TPA: zinc-dependent metalloprotease family protein [Pyrinomonadaceae bacterium]|nr:zinc-dependent metalloprotease family protein [Pyrinomonadaceae bacterium]
MPATSPNSWKRLLILGITVICFLNVVLSISAGRTNENYKSPDVRSNAVTSPQDSFKADDVQEKRLKRDIEKSIKRYELVKLNTAEIVAQVRRTGKLSLQTRSERYDLNLVPHDMRASNYRAEEVGIDGKLRAVKSGPIRTFKGTVQGMEGAQARFTVSEKRIEGLILKSNARLFLEPARKYSSSADSSDYILYNSLDVEQSELGCGATLSQAVSDRIETIESETALPKRDQSLGASTFRLVELATEADFEYVTELGGSAQANDDILSVMNQVDGIFNADVAIGFTIVYQHTWATPDDPYTAISLSGTLIEFTNYWNANMQGVSRDLAHLFTFRDANDFIGIAFISVACNSPLSSYAISRRRTYRFATLVAHEFGHNFGAAHIDNTSSCELSIMTSGVGYATTFCEFSRNQMRNHAANNSGCLTNTPSNCDYVLSATGQTFTKDAGGGTVNVTAESGCNWLATSNVNWISITGAGNPDSFVYFNGNGSATIDYTIQENSAYTRRGTIKIAGQDFTVTQAGVLPDCIVTPMNLGQTLNGTLSETDCGSSWTSFLLLYTDVYSFNGVAGQQLRLSMNAPTFVPYLNLMGPSGALVASSNNNGGPNNAYLPNSSSMLTLPTTGLYTLEATSWSDRVTGAFTLESVSTPTVVTAAASNVSTNGAQLNGNVNANSSATNAWFEWSTNSSLSTFNTTPQQSGGSANTNVSVSANLSGLASDTVYYYRLAATNATGVTRGSILSFVTTTNNVQVTVQTNPSNRSFTVDQTTYTSTQTFTWAAGSSHTISTTSPQSEVAGTQYVWSNWSDGGAMSHTVSPVTNTTFTANFATQHFLTMISGTCGSVSPASNWYNSGQLVSITATPNSNCVFTGWTGSGSGSYTGADNPAAVTMNAPITETGTFSQSPPIATTAAASNINLTSATLNGTVNPNGSPTDAWFEWGTSANLSNFNSTDSQGMGAGTDNAPLSMILNNLSGNTTYYFRIAASNSGGTTKGTIHSFITIPTPILLTEENSNKAIAFDSVTWMRDPFSITTVNNFSLDGRTRIMLLAANAELLSGENSSVVTAQAEDSQQGVFPLTVEYVGKVPAFDWLTQINIKLPDTLINAGDVWLSISLRGQPSNKVLIRIGPSQ